MKIKNIQLAAVSAAALFGLSLHPAMSGQQTHKKSTSTLSTFTPMMRGAAPPTVSLQMKPVTKSVLKPKFKSQFKKSAKITVKPTFKPVLKQQQVQTSAKRKPAVDRKSLHRQSMSLKP